MIPLRDTNHASSRPIATYAILAVNAAVFLFQLTLDHRAEQAFILEHGFVPRVVGINQVHALASALSSMFMHGGFMHFASNMWFLHIFGDNVEDALGSRRYLWAYFTCGFVAAAAQYAINPSSAIPMVGASGAIAGVLGAYLKLFPHARVLTLIPIFVFITVREIPAVVFLALWFGLQLLQGVGSLGASVQGGGVAFFAHIGGFVAGILFVILWRWLDPDGGAGGDRGGGRVGTRPSWRKPSDERGPFHDRSSGFDA